MPGNKSGVCFVKIVFCKMRKPKGNALKVACSVHYSYYYYLQWTQNSMCLWEWQKFHCLLLLRYATWYEFVVTGSLLLFLLSHTESGVNSFWKPLN